MCVENMNPIRRRRWLWVAAFFLFLAGALVIYKVCCPKPPAAVDLAAACQGDRWIGVLNQISPEERDYAGEADELRGCPDG